MITHATSEAAHFLATTSSTNKTTPSASTGVRSINGRIGLRVTSRYGERSSVRGMFGMGNQSTVPNCWPTVTMPLSHGTSRNIAASRSIMALAYNVAHAEHPPLDNANVAPQNPCPQAQDQCHGHVCAVQGDLPYSRGGLPELPGGQSGARGKTTLGRTIRRYLAATSKIGTPA